MKVSSPAITHKTDQGGVLANITDGAAVRAAYGSLTGIMQGASPDNLRVLVQRQAANGIELTGASRNCWKGFAGRKFSVQLTAPCILVA